MRSVNRKKNFTFKKTRRPATTEREKEATTPNRSPNTRSTRASFPIVGIGASAGGLEAFTELLRVLPTDTGLGFVLVQHLDPHHESALTNLLSRATALPVREITNNLRVEPNHVYVIPPNKNLGISQGILKLRPREQNRSAARSIDSFFEALAEDQRECAIGVILSGTATDGTLGLEAIKAEGGITFAQDNSARYDSMPRSAVAAGCVDFIINPEGIAKELARIANHPHLLRGQNQSSFPDQRFRDETALPSGGHRGDPSSITAVRRRSGRSHSASENEFKRILVLLHNHCGVDFSLYKSTTIQRRIGRRMVLNKHESLGEYATFLRGNTKELDALYSDALISVTSFFRNPECFEFLKKKIFPKFINQRGANPVRVWVLGCSTGQEAYSIAMAYMEAAEAFPHARKLQVFATDLNESLLSKARQGLYAKTLAEDLSKERLKTFFVEEEGGYRVIKPLRELVVFARQNLISDPPFSRMDLITCRNLLIYLEQDIQKKTLQTFHYALKPGGFLFLGASESIGGFSDRFETVDKKHKIYLKRGAPIQTAITRSSKGGDVKPPPDARPRGPVRKRAIDASPDLAGELSAQREADRVTINQFAPPGVLVSSNFQIVQFRGPTGAYLQPPSSGKPTFDVLKMARDGLMIPLRAAINKAKKENRTIRKENVRIHQGGKARTVTVEVIPLKNLREKCYLILFLDAERRKPPLLTDIEPTSEKSTTKKEESRRISELQTDLLETREYLRSMQDQHETANEELQAAHEEVQSANEELQSINEELETSKEELESSNEELITVNEEMAHRNAELNRLNADLSNLQMSTKLPILLLGPDLVIRRFSPPAEKFFNLQPTDVGRPLSGIRHKLVAPSPRAAHSAASPRSKNVPYPIEELAFEVIDTVCEREEEVQDADGRWYFLRVRPYITANKIVEGAVLVLLEITRVKQAEQEADAARDYAEMTLRTAPAALLVLHADLSVQAANDAFYRVFQTTAEETIGREIYELGNEQWNLPKLREFLEEIIPRNSFFSDFRVTHQFPKIGKRTMMLSGRRLDNHEGAPQRIFVGIEDVTPLIEAQAEVRISEQRHRRLFETAQDGIILLDPVSRKITDCNLFMSELAGVPKDRLIGRELWQIGLLPNEQASHDSFRKLQEQSSIQYETVFRGASADLRHVEVRAHLYQENGHNAIQCNIRDVTARKFAEEEIKEVQESLKRLNRELEERVEQRTLSLTETNSRLEELSKRLVRAQEDERGRIARELHDDIGQSLTSLKFLVERVSEHADKESFETIQRTISDTMQQVRRLSLNLHPQVLEDLGLRAALEFHFKSFHENTGIRVEFECSDIPKMPRDPELEITLFRVVQEALTNVARHAGVDRAEIRLFVQDGVIHLEIHDSGKGMDRDGMKTNLSFGLAGIRERVTLLGGQFRIDSEAGKGMHLFISMPVTD